MASLSYRSLSPLNRLQAGILETAWNRPPAVVWLPALAVAGAMVLPLAYLAIRAFGADDSLWDILFRSRTGAILGRSVLLVVSVTGASIALAVPLAWLTSRTDIPCRRLWSIGTALPLVIPSYIGAFVVIAALAPRGLVQGWLEPLLGIESLPDIRGFWGATFTLTILSFPYVLLPVRATMRELDPGMEETARALGYGPWQVFRRVTWPHLRPPVAAGSLLVALYTLSDFGAVSILDYETFTWAIYVQYESLFDRGVSAGLSLVLVALALAILVGETGTRSRHKYFTSASGGGRPAKAVALGRWRWPAVSFCGTIVFLSLGAPIAVLTYWVVRGLQAGESLGAHWGDAANSLYVSALAAGACLLAAIPVSVLSVRYPSRFASIIERTSYMGFALPGIVVALALVFFGANYVGPLYQTTALLVFAYAVLFLPTALGSVRASLLQVNPRVEEAARGLGLSPWRVFASVTLPLIRSGVLAGSALVFLTTMKELPATLILSPIGFSTLATSIWGSTEAAFFAGAAFPALLLVLLASAPMAILISQGARQDVGAGRMLNKVPLRV